MNQKLLISIDGGAPIPVNSVAIHAPDTLSADCTATLTFSHGGMVQELWDKSPQEVCIRTTALSWCPTLECLEGSF